MKLSVWAKNQGISYRTAWRWWHDGTLPVPAARTPTGTILVQVEAAVPGTGVALYARVSSADQKSDLDRQLARLSVFAAASGLHVMESATEVGSGLNGRRRVLLRLLRNPSISAIVVEHRDRLARFGFEQLEAALAAQNRRLIVVDATEVTDDIVRDITEVLTSMCARLYGKRSARNRAQRALEAIKCA